MAEEDPISGFTQTSSIPCGLRKLQFLQRDLENAQRALGVCCCGLFMQFKFFGLQLILLQIPLKAHVR